MSMETIRADYATLADLLEEARISAVGFHLDLADRRVVADYPLLTDGPALIHEGSGARGALAAFNAEIAPHLSGSIGPRYLGYATGGATPAAMVGDWLASAIDQDVGSPGDSIATQVSLQAIGWLMDLFGLGGAGFEGVFTTGATASNLLSVLSAREWAAASANKSASERGLVAVPQLQVFGGSPHITFLKVMGIAGLGRASVIPVATLPGREAMDPRDLDRVLGAASAGPKMVVASAGTVTTADFDALEEVAEICRRHDAWLHVDGAFGLFARSTPAYAALAKGIELAHSITGDAHKWLNVPYDCGFFFTKRMDLLQRACGISAVYLESGSSEPEFLSRGVESSQRFRALPVWMTLKAYGRRGVADVVEACCNHAQTLGRWIEASPHYELLAPLRLNVVCFRALPPEGDEAVAEAHNRALLAKVRDSGKVHLTPGAYGGKIGMRAAFCNWLTRTEDVAVVTAALERAAGSLP